MKLAGYGMTTIGRRARNEDCFLCDEALGFFCVSDGCGGLDDGDLASRSAVEDTHKRYRDALMNGTDQHAALDSAIRGASNALFARGVIDMRRRGATLSCVVSDGKTGVLIGHVGDSKVYLHGSDCFFQITLDHTRAVANGHAAGPGDDHVLTRAVGAFESVSPDIVKIDRLSPGEEVIIISDGPTRVLSDQDIMSFLGSGHDCMTRCTRLIDAVSAGPDNSTVVIIKSISERSTDKLRDIAS